MRMHLVSWYLCGLAFGGLLLASSLATSARADSFPAVIPVVDLAGDRGAVIRGVEQFAPISDGIATGDFNGDGLRDLALGSSSAMNRTGEVYVIYGTSTGIPDGFDLSTLDGTNGFTLRGEGAISNFGTVSNAGDVNADGIDDLFIGAQSVDTPAGEIAGKAYVVFGSSTGFPALFEVATLDGTNGFAINGGGFNHGLGQFTAGLGDVNGDGIDDVLTGANNAGSPSTGQGYVIYGSDSAFPAEFDAVALDGVSGFVVNGIAIGDRVGWGLGALGDVNGDGINDFGLGAIEAEVPGVGLHSGAAYVVFGSASGFPATFELSSLDGSNGFAIPGFQASFTYFGEFIRGTGDLNGDGIDDFLVSAPGTDVPGRTDAGQTYVIFGATDLGGAPSFDVNSLDGTNGFTVTGPAAAFSGFSASGAGDLNFDGLSDLLVPAPVANATAGSVYLIEGRTEFPAVIDLASFDGSVFDGTDEDDFLGIRASALGDLNGDGIDDAAVVSVGEGDGDSDDVGEVYLVYGRATCRRGSVRGPSGSPVDLLYLNGSVGGFDRRVEIPVFDAIRALMIKPGSGSGKFVLHANVGTPSFDTRTAVPFDVGDFCFPLLLANGAAPVIVANNIGKPNKIGESAYFGIGWDEPERATTEMVFPGLPLGTTLTFQGVIVDPGSASSRGFSVTNAVSLEIVP